MRRLYAYWLKELFEETIKDGDKDLDIEKLHVPDIHTADGLLDVLAVGHLLIFSFVLDTRAFPHPDEVPTPEVGEHRYVQD
ncbi:hypothetical protein PLICRDRAFT_175094 [Plicaturopsis crispa FD-325 SS-3]|nr:hypothetical protein PLICRDRAFT_175094 [Plicaturopsis crispa FD-325 SS-3]